MLTNRPQTDTGERNSPGQRARQSPKMTDTRHTDRKTDRREIHQGRERQKERLETEGIKEGNQRFRQENKGEWQGEG